MHELVGLMVMHRKSKHRGTVSDVADGKITVSYIDSKGVYPFPAALVDTLLLADKDLQNKYLQQGCDAGFDSFKRRYQNAVNSEISYLKQTGGKRYRIIDGERLHTDNNTFVYSFETDSEFHFPDGTSIKLWFPEEIIPAQVVSCEDFNIVIQPSKDLGEKVETVEFTAEPWQLMEALNERIEELDRDKSPIAYELACRGKTKIKQRSRIGLGQQLARRKVSEQPITFIWGPPGTGKTTTLANIALDHIHQGERVLMLSYSNVSVDGAVLKIAGQSDLNEGQIIRYGYPRRDELMESDTLTSYAYVRHSHPELESEYKNLAAERKQIKKKDAESNKKRIEIRKRLNKIREKLLAEEKELVQNVSFVATTVSKAVVDKTIYAQKFDLVIFDEASMAYIPQIVFAASLAKKHFCCLGDFRQLPAIVQNPADVFLTTDIFEYTGITEAVENGYGHDWLVMLNLQYRMHPSIAKFVSRYMYGNLLESSDRIFTERQLFADLLPNKREPMSIIDLSSSYSVCIKTMDGSRINLLSALVSMRLAEVLIQQCNKGSNVSYRNYSKLDVGIISPYSAQSRLLLAMIRDIRERNGEFSKVTCATVHQFQGSEKTVIIYDAVDCFRMPYPGTLLTSKKNNTADRLFNVAMTRTRGKFLLVANVDYLFRKNISKDLMFTKSLRSMKSMELFLGGDMLFDEIGSPEIEDEAADQYRNEEVFLGHRDEYDSWERYIEDIRRAKADIIIDMPGVMDDDEDAVEEFIEEICNAESRGVQIRIRTAEGISLFKDLRKFRIDSNYTTTPLTIIDQEIIWFGEPLSSADFISEGEIIETKVFPCLRFEGKHTARMLKAIYEIPSIKKER